MSDQHHDSTTRTRRGTRLRWYLWFSLLLWLMLLLPIDLLPANAQSAPPTPFSKLGPGNGAINIASPVTLTWEPAAGASEYTWCIDTTPDDVCVAGVNNSGFTRTTATNVTLLLKANTTYYWQVRASNEAAETFANGYLGWYSFTTASNPSNFTKIEPAHSSTNLPTSVTARWGQVAPDEGGFYICWDTLENFSCDRAESWLPIENVQNFTFPSLLPNTRYFWQVERRNAQGGVSSADGASGWHTFTTGNNIAPTPTPRLIPPGPFYQLAPMNGATDVPNPVRLQWEDAGLADRYTVCINQTTSCNTGYFGSGDGDVGARTAVTLTLLPGETFWWRVRAQNADGFTPAGNSWISFTTTLRPIAISKLAPLNNRTGEATDTTLRWSKAPFVTDYRLCYDRTDNNRCDADDDGWIRLGETVTYGLNGLEPNTVYSWQVRAHNMHGYTEANAQWFRFRTGPGPLNKLEPLNNSAGLSRTITLKWTPSIGAVGYGYCIDKTNNNSCDSGPELGYPRVNTTSTVLNDLDPNTTYYWHARAYNQFGDFTPANGPGGWFSFTTRDDGGPQYGPDVLPGDSGNLGPPSTESSKLCCISGYVYRDGTPVISSTVTIYDSKGGSLRGTTRSYKRYQYFAIDLNDPQLSLQPGDSVTLTAEVSGAIHSQIYTLLSGMQQVDLVLPSQAGYTRPLATINHRSHVGTMDVSAELVIQGSGRDSDATPAIHQYEWMLDSNPVNNSATLRLAAHSLTPGIHQITLRVQDDEGEWSLPVKFLIHVVEGWTLLVYFDGDSPDSLNEHFDTAVGNLVTMQTVGAIPEGVNVAILRDGPGNGDSQLLTYTASATAQRAANSTALFVSGNEVSMNDPATLTNFVKWGQSQFPNTHYYLSIANHGHGISGIAWDHTQAPTDDLQINKLHAASPPYLRSSEIDNALSDPEIRNIDILHLDACSMNMLEIAYELRNSATYLISSQFLTWVTFNYNEYVAGVHKDAQPVDVAKMVAQKYAASVQARNENTPYTISVLDLRYADIVNQALTTLTDEVQHNLGNGLTLSILETVRSNSQVFESENEANNYVHEPNKDFYIDVADWTKQLLMRTDQPAIQQKGQTLLNYVATLGTFIVLNDAKSGRMPARYKGDAIDLDKAHGLSIFYPVTQYQSILNRDSIYYQFEFARESNWTQLLSTGIVLPPSGATELPPDPVAPLVAAIQTPSATATPSPTPPAIPSPVPTATPNNQLFLPMIQR